MFHWGAHYHIGFWLEPGEWSQRLPGPALPRPHCQAQLAEGHLQAAEQIGRTRKPCPLSRGRGPRGLASPAVRVQLVISDLSSLSFISMRVGDMEPFAGELACWVHLCTDQAGNKQAKACNEPVLYIYIYIYTRGDNPTKKQQCLVEQDILFFGGSPVVPCGPGAWTFKLRDHGMQIRTAESYLVRRGQAGLARRLWRWAGWHGHSNHCSKRCFPWQPVSVSRFVSFENTDISYHIIICTLRW